MASMWALEQPEPVDQNEILDTALTYANGTPVYALSAVERAAIHAVYDLYDAMLGQPHVDLRPNSLGHARPHLAEAYSQIQIGARLEKLRQHLLASTDSCPYCGFGEPRDLDHYLPRVEFGELAIYFKNLIPSCSPCNNAKRTVFPGGAELANPGFIHPYFQELPDEDFLEADIVFHDGALLVSFRIDATNLEAQLAARLQFQLDRLKLNARYVKQINKFISEQRTALQMFHELDAGLLSTFLQRSSQALARKNGRNDWRVSLLRALSQNGDFCSDPGRYVGDELNDG